MMIFRDMIRPSGSPSALREWQMLSSGQSVGSAASFLTIIRTRLLSLLVVGWNKINKSAVCVKLCIRVCSGPSSPINMNGLV